MLKGMRCCSRGCVIDHRDDSTVDHDMIQQMEPMNEYLSYHRSCGRV